MKLHAVNRDLLPPKRYHGNLSKQLIDQRRLQLESYLQKLINRYSVMESFEFSVLSDLRSKDIQFGKCVLFSEVSSVQRLKCMQEWYTWGGKRRPV